jgi:hypothetical protein
MLRGLAIVVDDGGPHLQALPLESLPATAALRFRAPRSIRTQPRATGRAPRRLTSAPLSPQPTALPRTSAEALFKVKPAWRLAELEPFLEGIVGPDKKGEAVVLQHARCVTASDGSRSYVART